MESKVKVENWDQAMFEEAVEQAVKELSREGKGELPVKRIAYQLNQDPEYRDIRDGWDKIPAEARIESFKKVVSLCEKQTGELLPTCVMCGDCCRKGSPTLLADDLELLGEEGIKWDKLYTIREGEPARSPYSDEPFYLPTECIKLKEQGDPRACIFFAGDDEGCSIHQDRPLQCRAQACWDPEQAKLLQEEEHLTRKELFGAVEPVWQLIEQHNERCSFEILRQAFDKLVETEGKDDKPIIEILAFDAHVREFATKEIGVPADALDLVFGRSLEDRLRLFGYRIETDPDGLKTLAPLS